MSPVRLLAVALLAAPAALFAQVPAGAPLPPIQGTRLDVVVEGEATRAPDRVTIAAGVVTQAATAQIALQENAARMTATIAALRRAGIAERDIRTASLALQPQYRYGENQPPILTGYQASNSVSVRFGEIARAGAILDALVAAGANQIDGPEFGLVEPEAALDEARTQAMAKARARAELYAKAAGLRVVRIVAISEAGSATPQPPMPMARMADSARASTPVASGEERLTVSLAVSFELR